MTFSDYMRANYGDKWVLTARMTPALKARGYEVAVTPRKYAEAQLAWARDRAVVFPDILVAARVLRDYHNREAAEILAKHEG